MRVPGFALIHRARVVETVRAGAKDAQGERAAVETFGPWFPARRMTRRPGREDAGDPGGAKRAEKPWSLIWGDEDETGAALVRPPRASDSVEVEVELDDGTTRTFRYEVEGPPGDFDAGGGAFGGQAQLSEVVGAA